jgi:hypothetical protein
MEERSRPTRLGVDSLEDAEDQILAAEDNDACRFVGQHRRERVQRPANLGEELAQSGATSSRATRRVFISD